MTHDPTRDCEHGRLKGKCDVCDLQAEVLEQCRINGMSAEREDALRAELTQLKASIALDKMAEDARTIGLRLDDWDKIGCVNHDCDKCKAVQEPLHDEKVRLIAHNECPEDWDSLDNKECWLKGFVSGFKTAEREYKE